MLEMELFASRLFQQHSCKKIKHQQYNVQVLYFIESINYQQQHCVECVFLSYPEMSHQIIECYHDWFEAFSSG